MYKRLQWYWLNCATWETIPPHVVSETYELLGRPYSDENPPKIDLNTRLKVALQLHDAHLASIPSEQHRSYLRKLWATDEYPLIRRLLQEKRLSDQFHQLIDDPHTTARIIHAVPLGYAVKEITVIYRSKQIIVEIHPSRSIPDIQLPSDLKPFVVFCPWALSFFTPS